MTILTKIDWVCIARFYIDSDHFFNLSTPSTILGANLLISSLSIFWLSSILFINCWPSKSVKLYLANIFVCSKPKSDPGNKATPVSFNILSHISDDELNFLFKNSGIK